MNSQNGSNLNSSEAQSTAQYIHSFLDLVENLPNEISRHLSQLHHLNNNYLKLINRTDTNVDRYKQVMTALATNRSNCSDANTENKDTERSDDSMETLIEKRRNLSKKIETQLIQIQELSDEKLRYSQIIFDLIETKAKELDLDYEEVIQFNGKINTTVSESAVNRINGNTSHKTNATNSSQNGTNVGTASQVKEDNKQKEVNEDINNNKTIDKRSLPRRACALKSGQSIETNDEIIESNVAKVSQNKTIKSKTFSKSHNFGLSMSNFYRKMARRRAKLPKGSKIHKIGAKLSDSKKSVQSLKQNDRKSKSNRNSIKRLIAAKSGVKQTNGSNSEVNKKVVRNKSTNGYISSSSSSSTSLSENEAFVPTNGSDSRNVSQKKEKNSNQENGRRESKRSANNVNNNNNKKSKTNTNSFVDSTEQFVGEPIDPNEPTYCLCDQVSFGQMICCDNDRCSIEWFHFPCVGLEVKPKGKWYCPRCRKAPKLQNVPKRQTNSAKD